MTGTNRKTTLVIVAGAIIVSLAMGVRQAFGLFLPSLSADLGIGRSEFGLTLALQNLCFGVVQPFVGALADRHGAGRVVLTGALLYVAGLAGTALATSAFGLYMTLGLMIGLALSATTFVVVLGVVGRLVPAEQRGTAFGIVTAGGSLGQFLVVPAAQWLIGNDGYRIALYGLGALVALCALLSPLVAGAPGTQDEAGEPSQSVSAAICEAAGHRGYWLLNMGFFVCGFHIAFIATHVPAYLADKGLGLEVGAQALALVGLFNIMGSYVFGSVGRWTREKYALSALYGTRGLVIILFLAAPLTHASALMFAAAMGFLWLGTVPLTSGVVGRIFGTRYLSTLYGVVFMSHQIGSFFGAWFAGLLYDRMGNYDASWAISIGLALLAVIVHLPIRDRPVARLAPA